MESRMPGATFNDSRIAHLEGVTAVSGRKYQTLLMPTLTL